MLRLPVLLSLLLFTQLCLAQVRATTESGNKVLLFEDGTWKYEEKSVSTATKESDVIPVAVAVALPQITIDSTKEFVSEAKNLFYLPSPRLVRFFGEQNGRIRCKLSCSNTAGQIRIHYLWEIPVGDGQRYFGYFRAGSKITVHLQDGQKIELLVGEDSKVKNMERYKFTSISGSTAPLTNEQLVALTTQKFRKIEVYWKKKPESYEIDLSTYFMETLPSVF